MRVIFLGRKPWASVALYELVRRGHDVVCVVAPGPTELAREEAIDGPYLHETAAELGLRVAEDRELYAEIEEQARSGRRGLTADLVISFLFWKRILPPLISFPSRGCFNFHPAPLPGFRGRRGYNFAILEGHETYGASVHWVSEDFDEGDLVRVVHFPVTPGETALSLEKKTMAALLDLFSDFLDLVEADKPLPAEPQGQGRSATKKEMLESAQVWPGDAADIVDAKIRAFWYPPFSGAFTVFGGRKITLVNDVILRQLAADAHRKAEVAAGLHSRMVAARKGRTGKRPR